MVLSDNEASLTYEYCSRQLVQELKQLIQNKQCKHFDFANNVLEDSKARTR